jgi:hypothetical protein
MDWLVKHHGMLECASQAVTLTNYQGVEVKFASNLSFARVTQVNCLPEVEIGISASGMRIP